MYRGNLLTSSSCSAMGNISFSSNLLNAQWSLEKSDSLLFQSGSTLVQLKDELSRLSASHMHAALLSGNKSGGTLHSTVSPAYADIPIPTTSWTCNTVSKLQVSHEMKLRPLVTDLTQAVAILYVCTTPLRSESFGVYVKGLWKKISLHTILSWSSSGHQNCLLFILKWVLFGVKQW